MQKRRKLVNCKQKKEEGTRMKKISLQEAIEGLEDNRRSLSVMYPLKEVLFIMLCAIICGATSYVKVELFGKSRKEWLKKYLKLEYGIPDACTFRNVVRSIDTQQLHTVFVEWMKSVVENVSGVVSIDGKQARRTKDAEKKPLHVVSAFSQECGLVLGQVACEEKSNEITAIPKLLEVLELSGCIVTIDAIGAQSEIAEKIQEKGADYILALKGNQPETYEDVKLYFEEYLKTPESKAAEHYAKTVEKGHGRIETRECCISEDINWMNTRYKWRGLQGIGVITTTIKQNEETTIQNNYFIYSCKNQTPHQIMRAKRAHWGIENNLHWVLDMQFKEDESRARKDNSAENLNVLRQLAFNILKADTSIKGSFSDKQFKCLLDNSYLDRILSSF